MTPNPTSPMQYILRHLRVCARHTCPLFLTGPTGSGKTTLARQVHEWSQRRGRFVPLNCAALSEGIAESELFGHVRGAFTGAERTRAGCFELASEGTLFLDEVGDLSPANQARLLKAVEEGEVWRVGDAAPIPTTCRIIAATSRPELLRADLAYRLGGVVVEVPGLAARPAEILPLAAQWAEPHTLTACAESALLAHEWPGNVRELRNVITAASIAAEVAERDTICGADVAAALARSLRPAAPLALTAAAVGGVQRLPPPRPLAPPPSDLPPVEVSHPRWVQAWHLSAAVGMFSREDYEGAAGAPRSTAGRDLAAMVRRGILRVIPPHLYAWAGGAPAV